MKTWLSGCFGAGVSKHSRQPDPPAPYLSTTPGPVVTKVDHLPRDNKGPTRPLKGILKKSSTEGLSQYCLPHHVREVTGNIILFLAAI